MPLTEAEEERLEPQPHIKADIDKIALIVGKDGKIEKAEEKAAKARSDLGNLYQHIENDLHGNRKAVKLVRTLLSGTTDAAYDFMRTFLHLADSFDLIPEDDLLDLAAQKQNDEEDEGEQAETPVRRARRAAKKLSGLDAARAHLSGGTKPGTGEDPRAAYKFDPNPVAGEPGDGDLVRAGDEVAAGQAPAVVH